MYKQDRIMLTSSFLLTQLVNLPIAVHMEWVALTGGVVLAGSWKGMDEM